VAPGPLPVTILTFFKGQRITNRKENINCSKTLKKMPNPTQEKCKFKIYRKPFLICQIRKNVNI
jgi:hypothetical protein